MNDRNKKIVQAAQSLFSRYGVGKTTMNDIAREAGVARQTLYNAYPNKDEVLRAAVRVASRENMAAIEAAWAMQETLAEKLATYCTLGPLGWYDLVQASPDAAELTDGIHKVAKAEMDEAAVIWTQRFETIIRESLAQSSEVQDMAKDIAEYFYSASLSAKNNVENRAILERRLTVLQKSTLALIEQSSVNQS